MTTLRKMTRTKRKRRKFDPHPGGVPISFAARQLRAAPATGLNIPRHPFSPASHLTCMWRKALLLALACLVGALSAPSAPASAQSSNKSHAHDFVIFATVFTSQGYALPGARVRVRRADEKKFRWEAMSDHQGELGIRVPQDAEYELAVEARGFQSQTRKVDAREGNREDVTLRLEPLATGGKQ
jgi:hypothetical protein